jgi:LmbE family N-acetylglucosaminyl deacetylase
MLCGRAQAGRSLLQLLLVIPAAVVAVWLAGFIATTDLAVPLADVRRIKNVLAVFAHADDETVNCGGAIHRFSSAGAAVTLILLTAGERGNPQGVADSSLKVVRRREAERVAGILGVSRLIQQDFGDGQLAQRRPEVEAYLAQTIAEIAPEVILTHDLAGLYGHPDHITCAEILVDLRRAQLPNSNLWCSALPKRVVRLLKLTRQLHLEPNLEQRMAAPTLRIFIGSGLLPKIRAWHAYRSQRGSIARGAGGLIPMWFAVSMLQYEYFAEVA